MEFIMCLLSMVVLPLLLRGIGSGDQNRLTARMHPLSLALSRRERGSNFYLP